MKSMNSQMMCFTLWAAVSCSPNSKFNSSNSPDHSKEVEAKWAGTDSDSSERSPNSSGRIDIDCFTKKIDLSEIASNVETIKSVGIPSNCAQTTTKSSETSKQTRQFDVAVVLDVSWNMLENNSAVKRELSTALNKLHSENSIATLTGVAFNDSVSWGNLGNVKQTIELITGNTPGWSAQELKEIDPNKTDWIDNNATKKVLIALNKAVNTLETSSKPDKMLFVISNSIEKNRKAMASVADKLKSLADKAKSNSGQFIFNYASSNFRAQGLGEYDLSPLEQLNKLVSVAGISAVQAELGGALSGWADKIVTRSSTPSSSTESCILSKLEGFDSKDELVFEKELPVKEAYGIQNTTLPGILHGVSFKLVISRKCEKSGESSQTILVRSAQESAKK